MKIVTTVALVVSPSPTYPEESPLSWKDMREPLGGTGLAATTDAKRQVPFVAGSQLSGVSTHSFWVPQPSRVIFTC